MEAALFALLLLGAFLGHAVLSLALINRAHGASIPTRVGKLVWLSAAVLVPSVPLLFAYWFYVRARHLGLPLGFSTTPLAALPYLGVCWIALFAVTVDWFRLRVLASAPEPLRSDRRRVVQLLRDAGGLDSGTHDHHFLVGLPGNQSLDLDVAERGLDLPGLPQDLDGVSVLHISDLHFTGRVSKAYFEEVVGICNGLEPDLVAVTGDLVDTPECLDWIPETLGRLTSRYGNYFVLGNHDVEVGAERLRQILRECGLVDLGGRWAERTIGEERLILAGNELPWIPPAADLGDAPAPASAGGPLRIALSHSPDQLAWAQRNQVDLMLAGHLHGGQIRLPLIGPIVAPSNRGVTYASGVFYDPPTVMHVSRGVSGEIPLRLNCPPEVAKLTLHAASHESAGDDST